MDSSTKYIILFFILLAAWIQVHELMHILAISSSGYSYSYSLGLAEEVSCNNCSLASHQQLAFFAAAPYFLDVIVMLAGLLLHRRWALVLANVAFLDVAANFIAAAALAPLGIAGAADFLIMTNVGFAGLAQNLAFLGIITGVMLNAKYYLEPKMKARFLTKKKNGLCRNHLKKHQREHDCVPAIARKRKPAKL